MTDNHPITPPPELWLWAQQAQRMDPHDPVAWMQHVSAKAASWGADQELEACCEWLEDADLDDSQKVSWVNLRAARRPKPPSLAEQALALIDQHGDDWRPSPKDWDTIRRALGSLDD